MSTLLTSISFLELAVHHLAEKSWLKIELFGNDRLWQRVLGNQENTLRSRKCSFCLWNHYTAFLSEFKSKENSNKTYQFSCSVSLDNNIKSQLGKKWVGHRRRQAVLT